MAEPALASTRHLLRLSGMPYWVIAVWGTQARFRDEDTVLSAFFLFAAEKGMKGRHHNRPPRRVNQHAASEARLRRHPVLR